MQNLRIIIVTGMSGSGKSTALRALEDVGFFCVDNLPVVLLPKLLEIQTDAASEISKVALVMDLRERYFLEKYAEIFARLKEEGHRIEILFLDASDESLLRRFRETRRAHPLCERGTVMEGIALEREKLSALRAMADKIVDTSSFNVHQLKEVIQRHFMTSTTEKRLLINLMSFGFRYGLPPEADIVLDVRFLPNPYFIEELKHLNGEDEKIQEYVMGWEESQTFLQKMLDMMEFLIPLYEKEGKSNLNIALGCTGGKHRSVVMTTRLARYFLGRGLSGQRSASGYPQGLGRRDEGPGCRDPEDKEQEKKDRESSRSLFSYTCYYPSYPTPLSLVPSSSCPSPWPSAVAPSGWGRRPAGPSRSACPSRCPGSSGRPTTPWGSRTPRRRGC